MALSLSVTIGTVRAPCLAPSTMSNQSSRHVKTRVFSGRTKHRLPTLSKQPLAKPCTTLCVSRRSIVQAVASSLPQTSQLKELWVNICMAIGALCGNMSAAAAAAGIEGPLSTTTDTHHVLCTVDQPANKNTEAAHIVNVHVSVTKPVSHLQSQSPGSQLPLIVFSTGFLVPSASYVSYAKFLASWGGVSPTTPLDDVASAQIIQHLITWGHGQGLSSPASDAWLCGHSRGGKLSVLAAVVDSRVSKICLLDPVDNTSDTPKGAGFPSAVEALKLLKEGPPRDLPAALIIGAGGNRDCVPVRSNYQRFFDAWPSSCCQVTLVGAGHFAFLDDSKSEDVLLALCRKGSVDHAQVRQVCSRLLLAWGTAPLNAGDLPKPNYVDRTEVAAADELRSGTSCDMLHGRVMDTLAKLLQQSGLSSTIDFH